MDRWDRQRGRNNENECKLDRHERLTNTRIHEEIAERKYCQIEKHREQERERESHRLTS